MAMDAEAIFWAYEAMEDASATTRDAAPSDEAWNALVKAREDRTHFYTTTLPAAIRAFCAPLAAADAWTDEWMLRWAEDESRQNDRQRIAALPAEILADVRAAVAEWCAQAPISGPESAASLEEAFVEALVADLSELVHDVVSAAQEPGSKLIGLADPAAWGAVLRECSKGPNKTPV
jgi:hypothetical protein